ncbi:MAG: PAS domain S-box protein [Candidatus Marinimicrobia bacterium]|nr:PAS domain S-box protein [Candidatus Neomarinimicrobiota bacterium]
MKKKKILIVEDERIIAEDLQQTLRRLGYEITGIASSGKEALEKAAAKIPDLAIMDIVLPGKMDGITLAETLKERFDIPSIYLTAYADKTILKRAKISAPFGYILKPFDERELHSNIEIAFERSMTHRLLRRTNTVLKTIRDVNQLIVRERDRWKMIRQACKILTGEGGYSRAWIVLLDKNGKLTDSAQSGWGKKFQLLLKMLKKGEMPICGLNALNNEKVIFSKGSSQCRNCPFQDIYPEYNHLTIVLKSHSSTYGLLSVAMPERTKADENEQGLFKELAEDIAFSLHHMKLEVERKRVEKSLEDSEARFRILSESAYEAIVIHDKGIILDVNSTYCELFGYNYEEIVGMNILDFAAPESKDLVLNNVQRGYEKPYEAVGLCKDGSTFVGELIGKSIPYQEGTARVTIIRDITKKKETEHKLMESEERFRSLYENSTIGLYRTTPDGKILLANPTLVEMLGYSSFEELSALNLEKEGFEIGYPRNEFIKRIENEDKVIGFESSWNKHDGTVIHIQESAKVFRDKEGAIRYYEGTVEDITERKQAEENLKASTAVLEESQRVANLGSYALDITTGIWTSSDILDKLFGIEKDYMRDITGWIEIVRPDEQSEILDYFTNHVLAEHQLFDKEYRIIRKNDQEERWVHGLGKLDFDADGTPVKMIGTIQDITKRKLAEERLIKLSQSVEQSPASVMITDLDGNLEYVNPKFEKLTGYTSEEVLGQNPRFLNSGVQSKEFYTELWQKLMSGKEWQGEFCNKKKNGEYYWEFASISPILDKDGSPTHFVAVKEDITERKKAYEEISHLKKFNESILNGMTEGVVVLDTEGIMTYVNTATKPLLGYAEKELLGQHWSLIIPKDQHATVLAADERRKKGEDSVYDLQLVRKDGQLIDVMVSGSPRFEEGEYIGTLAVFTDITEQKRAVGELRSSEERYRSILDTMEEGYYEVDLKGHFTFFNDSLCRMLNYSRDELLGMNYRQYMQSESAEKVFKTFNEIFKIRKSTQTIEINIKRKKGSINYGEISITLLIGSHNKPVGFRGIVRDITERKKAEETLRNIAEAVSSETGALFFETLVQNLTNTLGVRYAFVGELIEGKETESIKTIAVSNHGVIVDNIEYDLTGTPCQNVVGVKHCTYTKQVQKQFPEDHLLVEMGVASYSGTPLFDSKQRPLGIMVIMDDKPLGNISLVESMLQVFAVRAAAELERRKTEKEITVLADAVKSVSECVSVTDTNDKILFVNEALLKTYGYEEDELIGKSVNLLRSPNNPPEVTSGILPSTLEGGWYGELLNIRKDGSEFPITLSTSIIQDEKGLPVGLIGVSKDISEQKQAEKILRESQEYSQNLIDSSLDIIVAVDIKRRITEFNRAAEEIFGYTREEVLGKHINLLYADVKQGLIVHKKVVEKGRHLQEIVNKRKNGDIFPALLAASTLVNSEGELIGVMGVSRDITDRKKSEKEIKSLARFPAENPNPIMRIDLNGILLYANKPALSMRSDWDFHIGQTVPEIMRELIKKTKKQIPWQEDMPCGNRIYSITSSLSPDTEYYDVFASDITDRIEAEEKRKQALHEAQRANEVKNLFLANMSHEIRTPLNTILGFSDLIEESTSNVVGEEEREFFKIVRTSGERLMHTVHEILDISQIDAGTYVMKIEDYNLVPVIEELVDELLMMAEEKNLKLEFNSTRKLVLIRADRDGIFQSINNIVDNAIKYTEKGKIIVELRQKSKSAILTIQDTGIGMSREYLDKIYETFTQESEGYTKKYQGIGLGMSIAKRHLDMNQVGIEVESTKGKGTTFTLTFPNPHKISIQNLEVKKSKKDKSS